MREPSPLRRLIGRQAIPRSTAGIGLVELMVVVTIISMLMAVGMPSYQRVQRKARAASLINDFRVFTAVLQARTHEAGSWPDETAAGVVPSLITQDDIQLMSWTKPPAIGGQFDWESNQIHNGVRYRAALALVDTGFNPLAPDLALYLEIDTALDDGNLTTGSFRLGQDNCLLFIIEPLMAASHYSVTLHHLAPGATAAGLAHPDEQLANVTPVQLRDLLYALSEVAAGLTIYEPSQPEIRIKTDRDVFVVRTRYRQLCLVGWETTLRGEEHSVPYILTTVGGGVAEVARMAPVKVERVPSASPHGSDAKAATASKSRRLKLTIMAVLILGFNGATAWMLFKPAPTLTPAYELMTETDSRTLLIKAAGEYHTGIQAGDRRLTIDPDGTLHFAKFGPNQAVLEPRDRPSGGAVVAGKPVLITNDKNPAIVEIKDMDTVVCTNTTYKRVAR